MGIKRIFKFHLKSRSLSTYDIGLRGLMEGLQILVLGKIPEIHLLVVSIASLQPLFIGLSEEIQNVLPVLVKQVQALAYSLREQAVEVV